MSDTPSLNPLELTREATRSADAETTNPYDLAGHSLGAHIGIGGMGEVYRCGDDALRRDLAVKVLRAELRGDADAEERFLREARLTGSLQHPCIVPVHHLGQLADGRPCYTMKLVRGRTLADLLREEAVGPERLPRLLAIVEKVCQAVAFAHSKGIIHRDLKPSNVMVGEFGEVQVMDWGLAKEQRWDAATEPADEPVEDGETVARTEEDAGLSRAGLALGTPAYMPPEQAAGDWDIVDERADVFALGAVLYEILTGRPPYQGANRDEVLRRARRGDVADALTKLEQCGAEAALTALCQECLAAERERRPRQAGVVAERLAAYQAEVQERLRCAELERARAEVRMLEEGKRRRLFSALAVAMLLLLAIGGAGWGQWQRRRAAADGAVAVALGETRLLHAQARANPLPAVSYDKAVAAAAKSNELARAGDASDEMRRQAEQLLTEVEAEAETAAKDRRLLARLLEVRGPREGRKYRPDDKGTMMALAEPTAEEQFASAFREWGLDVDAVSVSEAVSRLKERPTEVRIEIIAALDEWASQRRANREPGAAQRLAELAALVDNDPNSKRRELRAILARGQLPLERALSVLSAALRPVPISVEVPLGRDCVLLRQLAEQTDPAAEPILGLLTLVQALGVAGEEARAEHLLRAAIVARPREVVLHHTLGQLLETRQPPRWAEAVECYAAARVLRTDLGVNLATALRNSGRESEGLALLARLVSETPTNPYLHFQRAYALRTKGRWDEALAEYQKAITLDPKYAQAHNNLGIALAEKGLLDEAMAEYQKAIALDPKLAQAHNNLGIALAEKGLLDEAMAEYQKAIALDPKLAQAHVGLGLALRAKGRWDEAVAEYQKAIDLDPKDALAHNNLGLALADKGRWDEAVAEFRQAIALDPKDVKAHHNLGTALADKGRLDEAMAEYRQAIALDPKLAQAHYNLGNALYAKGRWDEALAEYQKAIALDPKHATAHNNLGNALRAKGRLDEALAEYQKAIALDPKHAKAHNNLGLVLYAKGRLDEALAEFRQAIALDPKYAQPHYNLGLALYAKGRWDEALAEFRQAIALDPKDAKAHNNLGLALYAKGRLDEALAEYQKAIALDPKDATAHYNRGNALADKGRLDEAMAEYCQAIRLNPNDAEAHCNLGHVLRRQGRFDEALASLRQGHELESKQPTWRYPSAQWVRDAERMLALDKKLPAILTGEASPANAGEAAALASMCQQPYKKRYAASARLYADAFAAEPKLAANLNQQHRYNAACSAALAAAGQGEDARLLPDKVAAMFRRWALVWLRDDLTACVKLAANPQAPQMIRQRLLHWQSDTDLASLRDRPALDRLPQTERAAWQALWHDVDELAKRVAKKPN